MQSNREILLVDDEPAVLNALKRELRPYFPIYIPPLVRKKR